MMNFPTWPCAYPEKREEAKPKKVTAKKVSKKISSVSKKISSTPFEAALEQASAFDKMLFELFNKPQLKDVVYIEDISKDPIAKGELINSLDDYISKLVADVQKVNEPMKVQKLANGSFIAVNNPNFDPLKNNDLDDVYSPNGDIPFPKISFPIDYYAQPVDFEEIANNWNYSSEDSPF